MPGALTHFLLCRSLADSLQIPDLKFILKENESFLLAGSTAPDLPYSSAADRNFFRNDSPLADRMHHESTTGIFFRGLKEIKNKKGKLSNRARSELFSFFAGYLSHITADGIIHPFVRDKVGDYEKNKTAHRELEMKLDIIFLVLESRKRSVPAGRYFDDTLNVFKKFLTSPGTFRTLSLFSYLINSVYHEFHTEKDIAGWIDSLYSLVYAAAGSHFELLKASGLFKSWFYPDFKDVEEEIYSVCTLMKPVDRGKNFLHSESISFINDCIPRFFSFIIPRIIKAYQFIYCAGPGITPADLVSINLDTGRNIEFPDDSDLIPEYWA